MFSGNNFIEEKENKSTKYGDIWKHTISKPGIPKLKMKFCINIVNM